MPDVVDIWLVTARSALRKVAGPLVAVSAIRLLLSPVVCRFWIVTWELRLGAAHVALPACVSPGHDETASRVMADVLVKAAREADPWPMTDPSIWNQLPASANWSVSTTA